MTSDSTIEVDYASGYVPAVNRPLVIVLQGPSGVGKDSVVDRLREKTGLHRATSSTSRTPRPDEVDGDHYHFLTEAEFMRRVEAGEFAEWARVFGDLKGLERYEIEGPLARGEDVIIRTDVQGARTWRQTLEGATFVFLGAEDPAALRRRLKGRKTEDPASLARRLAEFDAEMAGAAESDYVVINHHGRLDEAVAEIEAIIERERANPERPQPKLVA